MKKILSLITNDFRNVFRDPALISMFIVPFIIIFLLIFGLPKLIKYFPEIGEYDRVVLAFFSAMMALFAAFVISFIMLDEKDQNILDVIKVMPISKATFVFYRLAFIFFFGFVFNVLMISVTGIVHTSILNVVLLSLLFALLGPVISLTIITFAKNKIEGVTMLKGISFLILLPLLTFFLTSSWKYLLGAIPVFWSYKAFDTVNDPQTFFFYLSIGIIIHLLFINITYRQFIKRVF